MLIVKVPAINGLGKTKGCEKAPAAIEDELKKILASKGQECVFDEISVEKNNIKKNINIIEEKVSNINEKTIFIGGDHSITFPIMSALSQKQVFGLLVLDAHADCMQPMKEPTHEEWLRALIENGFPKENIVLVGLRAIDKQEKEFLSSNKVNIFSMEELQENFNKSVLEIMEAVRKFPSLYISIDIDIVDPIFVPGTGYPEPGGISSRELIYFVQKLGLLNNIHAIDIVEINPEKDLNEQTVRLAAKTISEFVK